MIFSIPTRFSIICAFAGNAASGKRGGNLDGMERSAESDLFHFPAELGIEVALLDVRLLACGLIKDVAAMFGGVWGLKVPGQRGNEEGWVGDIQCRDGERLRPGRGWGCGYGGDRVGRSCTSHPQSRTWSIA